MNYTSIDTQAVQLHCESSNGYGEVTINLHITKPTISVKKSAYISGVYDTSGNLNPLPPKIIVDTYKPAILNNIKTISVTENSQVTLKLNTKQL